MGGVAGRGKQQDATIFILAVFAALQPTSCCRSQSAWEVFCGLLVFFLPIPENIQCFLVVFLLSTFPSPIAAHAHCLLLVLPKKRKKKKTGGRS